LQLITLNGTHTVCRDPLDERSARHKDHYLYNTQRLQEKDNHVTSGIRTSNPSAARVRRPTSLTARPPWSATVTYDGN